MNIALFLLMLVVPGVPQQEPKPKQEKKPSLVELARQSKSRTTGTARVITNADLPSLGGNVATGVGAGSRGEGAPGAEAEAMDPDESAEVEIQELTAEFASARTNMETVVNQASVLQLRMNALRNAYFQQSDGVTRERLQYELNETYEAMQRNENQQKDADRAVKDLQSRARSLGMTPGAIRDLVGNTPKPKRIFEGTPGEPSPGEPIPPPPDSH